MLYGWIVYLRTSFKTLLILFDLGDLNGKSGGPPGIYLSHAATVHL